MKSCCISTKASQGLDFIFISHPDLPLPQVSDLLSFLSFSLYPFIPFLRPLYSAYFFYWVFCLITFGCSKPKHIQGYLHVYRYMLNGSLNSQQICVNMTWCVFGIEGSTLPSITFLASLRIWKKLNLVASIDHGYVKFPNDTRARCTEKCFWPCRNS